MLSQQYTHTDVIYCCFKKGLLEIDIGFIYSVEVRFLKVRYPDS